MESFENSWISIRDSLLQTASLSNISTHDSYCDSTSFSLEFVKKENSIKYNEENGVEDTKLSINLENHSISCQEIKTTIPSIDLNDEIEGELKLVRKSMNMDTNIVSQSLNHFHLQSSHHSKVIDINSTRDEHDISYPEFHEHLKCSVYDMLLYDNVKMDDSSIFNQTIDDKNTEMHQSIVQDTYCQNVTQGEILDNNLSQDIFNECSECLESILHEIISEFENDRLQNKSISKQNLIVNMNIDRDININLNLNEIKEDELVDRETDSITFIDGEEATSIPDVHMIYDMSETVSDIKLHTKSNVTSIESMSTQRKSTKNNRYFSSYHEFEEDEDHFIHQIFEKKLQHFWDDCKREVENLAEKRAQVTLRTWQREATSLDDAIETTLKEYGEMYEKAVAVKLLFEYEKQKWKDDMFKMITVNTKQNQSPNPYYYEIDDFSLDSDYDHSETRKRKYSSQEESMDKSFVNLPSTSSSIPSLKKRKFKSPLKEN